MKVSGTKIFQLSKKLKNIKYELENSSNRQFGNFHDKVTKNEQKITYVEEKLLDNPSSFLTELFWMIRLLKHNYCCLIMMYLSKGIHVHALKGRKECTVQAQG